MRNQLTIVKQWFANLINRTINIETFCAFYLFWTLTDFGRVGRRFRGLDSLTDCTEILKWAVQCENVPSGICRQRRPRSACAVWSWTSLSDNRIIGHCRMTLRKANARIGLRIRGMNLTVRFAHARRYLFAWYGPNESRCLFSHMSGFKMFLWWWT